MGEGKWVPASAQCSLSRDEEEWRAAKKARMVTARRFLAPLSDLWAAHRKNGEEQPHSRNRTEGHRTQVTGHRAPGQTRRQQYCTVLYCNTVAALSTDQEVGERPHAQGDPLGARVSHGSQAGALAPPSPGTGLSGAVTPQRAVRRRDALGRQALKIKICTEKKREKIILINTGRKTTQSKCTKVVIADTRGSLYGVTIHTAISKLQYCAVYVKSSGSPSEPQYLSEVLYCTVLYASIVLSAHQVLHALKGVQVDLQGGAAAPIAHGPQDALLQ